MNFPEMIVLIDFSISIGHKLSSISSKTSEESNTVDFQETMFVKFTNEQEVSETLPGLKNK